MTLRTPEGRPYLFDPGALCLELLVTGGPGVLARYEVLHEPADLVRWAAQSRLPGRFGDLTVSGRDLAAARELRDALHRLAASRAHGRALASGDLDVVNARAAGAPLAARIEVRAEAGVVRAWGPGATGARLLSTVARDAVELFTGPYAHRIRACGAHDCSLLYVDTSRPGRRRWCAMERCGNRNKARAHRARAAGTDRGESEGGRLMPTGLTQAGLTKDAGWEIGVSRTLPHPPSVVWDYVASPEGVALWLGRGAELSPDKGAAYRTAGGVTGEVRGYRVGDRIRVTHGSTTVQVAVSDSGTADKAVLRFHQERLASAEEREARRVHWRAVMDAVAAALEKG